MKAMKARHSHPKPIPCIELQIRERSSVLARLRYDKQYCDCIISAGGEDIPAHINIISSLSPFFDNALNGSFKEGKEKRITIGDATARSLHIILDHVYELPVKEKLENDLSLVLEVWELAHRFEMKELCHVCGHMAIQDLNVENAVFVYHQAKLFDSKKCVVQDLFEFIAHRFENIFRDRDAGTLLTVDEIFELIQSQELVTTEMGLIDSIHYWINANKDRQEYSEELLSFIHFDLLNDKELNMTNKWYGDWLPKSILRKALMQVSNKATSLCPYNALVSSDVPIFESMENNIEGLPRSREKFFFPCNHWITSAIWCQSLEGSILISLKFERRSSFSHLGRITLLNDVQRFSFDFDVKMAKMYRDGQLEWGPQLNQCGLRANESAEIEFEASPDSWRTVHDAELFLVLCLSAVPLIEEKQ